jgi:hypothetical protein
VQHSADPCWPSTCLLRHRQSNPVLSKPPAVSSRPAAYCNHPEQPDKAWSRPITDAEAIARGGAGRVDFSGGTPEIVERTRTGILLAGGYATALALAVSQVLDNVALARAMDEAGRRRAVERFSWEVVSRRLADLINSAASMHVPAQTRA